MPSGGAPRGLLGADGLPEHGTRWGSGWVLRAISRGPGVPVPVSNPHGGPPLRVSAALRHGATLSRERPSTDRMITLLPDAPEGEVTAVVVEF